MSLVVFLSIVCLWVGQAQSHQVVLITGASRGIGYATAELLAKEGYTVYAGVRETSSFTSLKQVHHLLLDVTDQQSIDLAVKMVIDNEGRLDVLVNNAGIMV